MGGGGEESGGERGYSHGFVSLCSLQTYKTDKPTVNGHARRERRNDRERSHLPRDYPSCSVSDSHRVPIGFTVCSRFTVLARQTRLTRETTTTVAATCRDLRFLGIFALSLRAIPQVSVLLRSFRRVKKKSKREINLVDPSDGRRDLHLSPPLLPHRSVTDFRRVFPRAAGIRASIRDRACRWPVISSGTGRTACI